MRKISASKCLKQIARWKQRNPQQSGAQVKVVAGAVFQPLTHPGQNMQSFANVSQDDEEQAACAQQQIPRLGESPLEVTSVTATDDRAF